MKAQYIIGIILYAGLIIAVLLFNRSAHRKPTPKKHVGCDRSVLEDKNQIIF